MTETGAFPKFPPPIDMKELAAGNYEIYQNGEFLCSLISFVERLARDYSNADPWRKLYEEHLVMCTKSGEVHKGLSKEKE